jgi:hypothetical protein
VSLRVSIPNSQVPVSLGAVPPGRRLVHRDFSSAHSTRADELRYRSNVLVVRANGAVVAEIPIRTDAGGQYLSEHWTAGLVFEQGEEVTVEAPGVGGPVTVAGVLE